jgi:hypothetical protein
VFKERELVKTKGVEEWQQEKHLRNFFIEIIKQLQHSGVEKNLQLLMKVQCKIIGLDCLII